MQANPKAVVFPCWPVLPQFLDLSPTLITPIPGYRRNNVVVDLDCNGGLYAGLRFVVL